MTCPKCQFQNQEETLVCQNCKEPLHRRKFNFWKIGLAILIVIAVGIYVLDKYTKKNSYPIKPTIDKVEFVYTSPTPLPTITIKIGDTLEYQQYLQADTSSWKEYKKEVDGLLISFKYPKQYEIQKYSQGMLAEFDSLIVKTSSDGTTSDSILIFFGRPYDFNGIPYTHVDDKVSLIEGVQRNYSSILDRETTVVREIQTKSKKVVRIEYEAGWLPYPTFGPIGETYVVLDNGYLFIFENHHLISLEEFITILDSFKIEKCLKFC